MEINKLYCGDCRSLLKLIPANTVDLVITSPPYFQQREYGHGQGLGNEPELEQYIANILAVFKLCVRVTKKTGLIVFNLGDKYNNGNLLLVPYHFALAVQKENLVSLVNELTWLKLNPVPKQDTRKLTSATEPFFIFAKSKQYHFDKARFMNYRDNLKSSKKNTSNNLGKSYFKLIAQSDLSEANKIQAKKELQAVISAVKSGKLDSFRMKIKGIHALPYGGQAGGRLSQIETKGFTIIKIHGKGMRKDIIESTVETKQGHNHPAVYPEFIVQELIKLLTKEQSLVLDPFLGSGTTAIVAKRLNRNYIGLDIHQEYIDYAQKRLEHTLPYNLELLI